MTPSSPNGSPRTRDDVVDVAWKIRSGIATATGLVRDLFDAIDVSSRYEDPFVVVWRENAMSRALWCDEQVAQSEIVGSLHGVPLAHKDLFDRAGRVSSRGLRHRTETAVATSAPVALLDQAGAIDIGRLAMSELALGPTGLGSPGRQMRHPHRNELLAGGSSGGSAVAVAAGFVSGSLGTDTGGSIRIPAAFCGVVGMKPSHGLGSTAGVMPLAPSMDTVGPLATSVRAAARILDAITDRSVGGLGEPAPGAGRYEVGLGGDPLELNIGFVSITSLGGLSGVVEREYVAALGMLESYGFRLTELDVDLQSMSELGGLVLGYESSALWWAEVSSDPSAYCPDVVARLRKGSHVTRAQYRQALAARSAHAQDLRESFAGNRVVILPTCPIAPPFYDELAILETNDLVRLSSEITRLASFANYLGCPALTVPWGELSDSVSGALQLVGLPGFDSDVLLVGSAIESICSPSAGTADEGRN